ncbi:MAG: insulinase family protein [SAR324 cluster bacterium]|nr:insulinase family protein [SAR324 cluster bacterium]
MTNNKSKDLIFKYHKKELYQGFELQNRNIFPDLNLVGYEFIHQVTKARLVYLDKDDPNKTFGVVFKTIPQDSSGVAHILEHVVLCGSKKYPVRDPFFSMLKRSLQNFMNAFTANDWTMYPFSTVNEKDFFNLFSVYLDAAFFPKISHLSFLQEGWRVELADNSKLESDFLVKGVVFNEMKGAMSTQAEIMSRRLLQALYPTVTYHQNSGGEPVNILELTWENLKKFHETYYHPSNASFFLYGDVPLMKALKILNKNVLSNFLLGETDIAVAKEERYKKPKISQFTYPKEGEGKDLCQLMLAWLNCENIDMEKVMIFKILDNILLSNSGAPLRKALIESKLGSSLSDSSGYESELKDTFFAVGLKGVEVDDLDKVENLILDTLAKISKTTIARELIDSALHQFEITLRDLDASTYPKGLTLLLSITGGWLHGAEPLKLLDFSNQLDNVKQTLKKPRFLENLIESELLNNNHRVRVELRPEHDYLKKQDHAIAQKVQTMQKDSSLAAREFIQKNTIKLTQSQKIKENIDMLPKVELSDINLTEQGLAQDKLMLVELDKSRLGNFYYYRQPTNQMAYWQAEFSAQQLSTYEKELLPTLGLVLVGAGTANSLYDKMALKISRYTGGVDMSPNPFLIFKPGNKIVNNFVLTSKCLVENFTHLVDIIKELVAGFSLHNTSRIEDLLKQKSDGLRNHLLSAGHSYANKLAMKNLHGLASLEETYFGITQIKFAQRITKLNKGELTSLTLDLTNLAKKIFSVEPEIVLIAPEDKEDSFIESTNNNFGNSLKMFSQTSKVKPKMPPPNKKNFKIKNELCLLNTPVSYVAQTYKVGDLFSPDSPTLLVLANLLRGGFLHREIREKGGAYGAMTSYDAEKGLFSLLSYRDPNLSQTWHIFGESLRWAAGAKFSEEELSSAIIQSFSKLDKPISVRQQALRDYNLKLIGVDYEFRNSYRQALVSINFNKITKLASELLRKPSAKAAISSAEIWEQEKANLNQDDYNVHQL